MAPVQCPTVFMIAFLAIPWIILLLIIPECGQVFASFPSAVLAVSMDVRQISMNIPALDLETFYTEGNEFTVAILAAKTSGQHFIMLHNITIFEENDASTSIMKLSETATEISAPGCTGLRPVWTKFNGVITAAVGCLSDTPLYTLEHRLALVQTLPFPSFDVAIWERKDGTQIVAAATPTGLEAVSLKMRTFELLKKRVLPPAQVARLPLPLALEHFNIDDRNFLVIIPREESGYDEVSILAENLEGDLTRFQKLRVPKPVGATHFSFSRPDEEHSVEHFLLITTHPQSGEPETQTCFVFKIVKNSFLPFQSFLTGSTSEFVFMPGKEAVLVAQGEGKLIVLQYDGWRLVPMEIATQKTEKVKPLKTEVLVPYMVVNNQSLDANYEVNEIPSSQIEVNQELDSELDVRFGTQSSQLKLRVLSVPGGLAFVILDETPKYILDIYRPEFTLSPLTVQTYQRTRIWCEGTLRETQAAQNLLRETANFGRKKNNHTDEDIIKSLFRMMFAGAKDDSGDDNSRSVHHLAESAAQIQSAWVNTKQRSGDEAEVSESIYLNITNGSPPRVEQTPTEDPSAPVTSTNSSEKPVFNPFYEEPCRLEAAGNLKGVEHLIGLNHQLAAISSNRHLELFTPINGSFYNYTQQSLLKLKENCMRISQFSKIDLCHKVGFYIEGMSNAQTVGQVYSVEENSAQLVERIGVGRRLSVKGICTEKKRQCFLLISRGKTECIIQCGKEFTYFPCTSLPTDTLGIENPGIKEARTYLNGHWYRLIADRKIVNLCRVSTKEGNGEDCKEIPNATGASQVALTQFNGKLVVLAVIKTGLMLYVPEKLGNNTTIIPNIYARLKVFQLHNNQPLIALLHTVGADLYNIQC